MALGGVAIGSMKAQLAAIEAGMTRGVGVNTQCRCNGGQDGYQSRRGSGVRGQLSQKHDPADDGQKNEEIRAKRTGPWPVPR